MLPTKKGKIKHNLNVYHDISSSESISCQTNEKKIANNLIGYIFYPIECSASCDNEGLHLKEESLDKCLNDNNDDINVKLQNSTKLVEFDEYLLIIPYSLTKLVSYAAQQKKDVIIRKYSFLPINQNGKPPLIALEIHKNGIDTIPTSYHECGIVNQQSFPMCDSHQPTTITGTGTNICSDNHQQLETESILKDVTTSTSISTLADIQEMETLQNHSSLSKKGPHIPKTPIPKFFSIVAKVDAISPIIIVPSDSFAIIELYQPGTTLTCVAILKGNDALQSFPACHPGDIVQLINVKRQKWHVPNSLFKHGMYFLSRRVSSYVYVITKASSIRFQSTCKLRVIEQSNFNLFHENYNFCPSFINAPLPSTVDSLYSIDAMITSLIPHHPILGKDIYQIQILNISPDIDLKQKEQKFLLFLSNYPITMSLSAGLRTGACIRAINVHILHKIGACHYLNLISCDNMKVQLPNHGMIIGFALCCRSSLMLILTASESEKDSIEDMNIVKNKLNGNAMFLEFLRKDKDYYNMNLKHKNCCNFNYLQSKIFLSNRKKNISHCIWRLSIYNLFTYSGVYDYFDHKEKNIVFDRIVSSLSTKCLSSEQECENKCYQKRKVQRNPYAEFFDHAVEDIMNENEQKIEGCCGIHATKPFMVDLNEVYERGIAYIQQKLQRLKTDFNTMKIENGCIGFNVKKRFCFAWTGSDKLVGKKLFSQLIPEYAINDSNCDDIVYTCGMTEFKWNSYKRQHQLYAIHDKVCRLPLTILQRKQNNDSNPSYDDQKDYFILVSVDAIVLSFICLGEMPSKSSTIMQNGIKARHLTSSSTLDDDKYPSLTSPKLGSCALFCVDNQLFMASVHLVSNGSPMFHKIKSNSTYRSFSHDSDRDKVHKTISLLSCLELKKRASFLNMQEKNIIVTGYLLRHQFRLCKVKNHIYSGLVITICHRPKEIKEKKENKNNASAVQCVDITVSMFISSKLKFEMKLAIKFFDETTDSKRFMSDEKIAVACAWWQAAEGKNDSNSLVYGGLVESNTLHNVKEFSHMHVPLSSFSIKSRGIMRGICHLADLCLDGSSNFGMFSDRKENSIINQNPFDERFQVEGGQKHISGMLENFTHRKSWGTSLGEMNSFSSKLSGIPKITIEDFYYEMLMDLKEEMNVNLTPSRVRCVVGARLLQIGFCRARVQCTKCYQFLINKSKDDKEDDDVDNQAQQNGKKTYWHLPLPIPSKTNLLAENHKTVHDKDNTIEMKIENSMGQSRTQKNHVASACKDLRKSNLRCPSSCSLEFATVKWECSGTLDGYGQAKLFADHEAAIALLGKGLDVETIEKGAWYDESGIVYNRCVPPSANLKRALEKAKAKATSSDNVLKSGKLKRKRNGKYVLDFLSIKEKSEYLLYRHCRESKEPSRPLQFLCRCKLLPRNKEPLRQTHVEVIENRKMETESSSIFRGVPTFTLPELKLILIDLCAEETYCSVGWDLLRQIESKQVASLP